MNAIVLRRLRSFGPGLALMAAIALTTLLASGDAHAQPLFDPCSEFGLSDAGAGAQANISSTFGVGLGPDCRLFPRGDETPDVQFGATVNFTPPEWELTPGDQIPIGALVARLESQATLGFLSDGCANGLGVGFDMMNATVDMSTTVPFFDPEKEADPEDVDDNFGSEPDDQFDVGSDGLQLGVTRYPDYLTRIFKDPSGNTLTPIARMFGIGLPEPGGIEVSLNFVLFEPGITLELPNGEIVEADPRLGYPSATVLQAVGDPGTDADIEDNNSVSDFCSPLQADTTVFAVSQDNPETSANEGGVVLRKNPGAGTYNFVTYAMSQRDADDDGIENAMDPCPTIANPDWDPRVKISQAEYSGDQDKDGLPDNCDPDPAIPSSSHGGVRDEDDDLYANRGDNCPLIANSLGQAGGSGTDNQEDGDSDGIGDLCDPNPSNPDTEGLAKKICLVSPIDVGGGGTPPDPAPQNMRPCDPDAALPADTGPTDDTGTDDTGTDDTGTTDTGTTDTGTTDTTDTGGAAGGAATGVGSLAPVASSIPTWASIVSALGGAGLLGSLGALAARIFGIRLPGRRD